jgi:hypothetical protein
MIDKCLDLIVKTELVSVQRASFMQKFKLRRMPITLLGVFRIDTTRCISTIRDISRGCQIIKRGPDKDKINIRRRLKSGNTLMVFYIPHESGRAE